MNLIDRVASWLGYAKAAGERGFRSSVVSTGMADAYRFDQPDPGYYSGQVALYQKLSWVNTAVTLTAQAAASVKLRILRRRKGGDPEELSDHPFLDLLTHPNPLHSRSEFMISAFSYRLLTGNSYVWINRVDPKGEPLELWTLSPNEVKPVPDLRLFLAGYEYSPQGLHVQQLPPWQIMHLKKFNPINPFVGLSPLEALATVAVGDLEMQKWNTALFGKNNARLPGVIAFADMINAETWDAIKDEVRDAAMKRQMLMLRGTGQGGFQWMQAAATQREMEFLGGRKFNREEIFATFAPGLASIIDVNSTEANANTGKSTFTDFTLYPLLTEMAEKITTDILPAYGDDTTYAEFEDIRVTDRVLELQQQQEYAKTHTVAEIRRKYYGEEPLGDDRDRLMPAQINAATGDGTEPPQPAAVPGQVPPEQTPTDEAGREMDERQDKPDGEEDDEAEQREEMKRWRRKALKALARGASADVDFDSDVLDAGTCQRIHERLQQAHDDAAVKAAFTLRPQHPLIALAAELRRANDLLSVAQKAEKETDHGHDHQGDDQDHDHPVEQPVDGA